MIFSPNITFQRFLDDADELHEWRVDGGDVVRVGRTDQSFGGATVVLVPWIRDAIWILNNNKLLLKTKQKISKFLRIIVADIIDIKWIKP